MPRRQPLTDIRRHQKRLLAITRDKALAHHQMVLNPPDATRLMRQPQAKAKVVKSQSFGRAECRRAYAHVGAGAVRPRSLIAGITQEVLRGSRASRTQVLLAIAPTDATASDRRRPGVVGPLTRRAGSRPRAARTSEPTTTGAGVQCSGRRAEPAGGQVRTRIRGSGVPVRARACHAAGAFILWVALLMPATQAAQAYQFSPATQAACPACTTTAGQAQAAELAEGLAINGTQSETFGSTMALTQDAAATSEAAAAGAGRVSVSLLLRMPVSQAFWAAPWWTVGLGVGAFATGYVVGTAGRAIVIELFAGDGEAASASWSNARWRMCTDDPCGTTLSSSASIPHTSFYAAWQDRWSGSTNVSATPTSWLVNCMYGCQEVTENSGWGPQAGDLSQAPAPSRSTALAPTSGQGTSSR